MANEYNAPEDEQERNTNISEKNFKKVISDVDKLKSDIKQMITAMEEIKAGQDEVTRLLEKIEAKS